MKKAWFPLVFDSCAVPVLPAIFIVRSVNIFLAEPSFITLFIPSLTFAQVSGLISTCVFDSGV